MGPVTTIAIAIFIDSLGRSPDNDTPVLTPICAMKFEELMTLYR